MLQPIVLKPQFEWDYGKGLNHPKISNLPLIAVESAVTCSSPASVPGFPVVNPYDDPVT